jgi:ArsR family transcriptional regulator, arsenate/arsenite/antimonite-responsive transcriptional repressor / arsenate reductase (thioredoxin)
MVAERISDVERRAAVYGALADPTRLRIVDQLVLGDAASSELSTMLSTPSNLLAHHLRILEAADLIGRQPSEGDGRRSYWRLVTHAFEPLGSPSVTTPDRIVFVCTANTARSHLAAALWRNASEVPAASAGTHPARRIEPGAVSSARRHGLELPDVRPQRLADVATEGALVVTVCDRAHEELGAASDLHWSIPDPVAIGTKAAFDRAFDELAVRVDRLTPCLEDVS